MKQFEGRFELRIDPKTIRALDELAERNHGGNRSAAIRTLIREAAAKQENETARDYEPLAA